MFFLFFHSGFFILERRANLSTEKFDNGRNLHPSNEHTSNGKRTCHRSAAHKKKVEVGWGDSRNLKIILAVLFRYPSSERQEVHFSMRYAQISSLHTPSSIVSCTFILKVFPLLHQMSQLLLTIDDYSSYLIRLQTNEVTHLSDGQWS